MSVSDFVVIALRENWYRPGDIGYLRRLWDEIWWTGKIQAEYGDSKYILN